ncbi:hypothetical protein Tco_0343480 [Tanacetum coccineum]
METKDTLSSCSDSDEQEMQQMQDKAKESCIAFAKLFDQDVQTFTGTMFLNVDQLQKQLDKEEFQKIGSMAAFRVLKTQFQNFINSRFSLDDDGLMTRKVNERQMQTTEGKVDTSKALDASLADTKKNGTES